MLKKLFVLPLVFILLCGCTYRKNVDPVLNNISFVSEIKYGDHKYVADVEIKNNVLKLVVGEPKNINNLTLFVDKKGVTAKFGDIEFVPDINSIPQCAMYNILYKVINDVNGGITAKSNGDNCEIISSVGDVEYNFKFSPSGLPICLKIDEFNLEILFKNVTIN